MFKLQLLLIHLLISYLVSGQVVDNQIQGYYQAKSDESLYSYFEFDGNGKVNIVGMGNGDYFIKGDSLIIFPDKSLFKFKIKGKTLIGTSNWVENQTWVRKDTVVTNNRKDNAKAKKNAELLNEYYNISNADAPFDLLMDDEKSNAKQQQINKLCNQGLGKACLDYFGILLVKDQGLENLLQPKEGQKPKPINNEIVALGNKIIAQGDPEGYTVLGSYYYLLGKKEKAIQLWNLGVEKGSNKSALALFQIEME